jgi:hypothetical protein
MIAMNTTHNFRCWQQVCRGFQSHSNGRKIIYIAGTSRSATPFGAYLAEKVSDAVNIRLFSDR